jgi:hypothetical protein
MTSMAGGSRSSGWQIEEHDSYDEAVLRCGGHNEVDDAIGWLDLFLSRNPLAAPLLRDGSQIRILKTKLRIKGQHAIPAYRLLFTVDQERRKVTKLHVALSEPEDMALGDPWDEYNDPTPF